MKSKSESLIDYIDERRTITFENLLNHFDLNKEFLKSIIVELEETKRVRLANSSCTHDCSSCSSHEERFKDRISDKTIIISLKLKS